MPQSILHNVPYGRVVPKKRLVRPGLQAKREREAREQLPPKRAIDSSRSDDPPVSFAHKNVTHFLERDTGVMDVMYPSRKPQNQATQAFGIDGNILRPPVDHEKHIDPKAALRLKWSEKEERPANQPPPPPQLEPNRDIFGKPIVAKPAPRPPTPTIRNPVTLQPDPHYRAPSAKLAPQAAGTPWKYDVFGNEKPSELRPGTAEHLAAVALKRTAPAEVSRPPTSSSTAVPAPNGGDRGVAPPTPKTAAPVAVAPTAAAPTPRPVASIDQIGQYSIHEHYAKVMKAANRETAALQSSAAAATARHTDPNQPLQAESPKKPKLDIFGKPIKYVDTDNFARRKPIDHGGEGVQIGEARPPLKIQRTAVPLQFQQPPAVTVRPDEPTAAAPLSARSKPDNTAARREAQQKAFTELTSTDPGSVLRTSAFYRELLRLSKGWGLRPIRLELRARDTDADGLITVVEARRAFGSVGVTITDSDAEIIRRASAIPDLPTGRVFLPRLMESLRGPLPPASREAAIRGAFLSAARGASAVAIPDLCARFEPRGHVAYDPNDRASPRVIQQSFGKLWGPDFASSTALVTEEHFVGFFRDVSVAVTADSDFRKMMGAIFPQATTTTKA